LTHLPIAPEKLTRLHILCKKIAEKPGRKADQFHFKPGFSALSQDRRRRPVHYDSPNPCRRHRGVTNGPVDLIMLDKDQQINTLLAGMQLFCPENLGKIRLVRQDTLSAARGTPA